MSCAVFIVLILPNHHDIDLCNIQQFVVMCTISCCNVIAKYYSTHTVNDRP